MIFQIDSQSFNVMALSLTREFQVLDTENSGRVIASGEMFRDIIGTFYNYTLKISASNMALSEYDRLYEILSSPVDFHTIKMPYAQGYLTYQAYITSGTDNLQYAGVSGNKWGEMELKFVAKKRSKS